MFDALTARLTPVLNRLRGRGVLTEENVSEALREVRRALLEADVNVGVARAFIDRVRETALGAEITRGVGAGQQMIGAVHAELVRLLGGDEEVRDVVDPGRGGSRIMVLGLQGSGKTTFCGKLARRLSRPGRTISLLGLDPYRPAAGEQLSRLGGKLDLAVSVLAAGEDPVTAGVQRCRELEGAGAELVLIDTAGRQTVDDRLMDELGALHAALEPQQTLLVLDAMTGQDAVRTAAAFTARVECTGAVLTKLDGDARGGAALSLRETAGLPIVYAGTGEALEDLDLFHPGRMADRILGMGDVVTLVEKATQEAGGEEALAEEGRRFLGGEFTLEDFREQIRRLRSMGPLSDIVGMLPGQLAGKMPGAGADESSIVALEAIIDSMTPEERRRPSIINASRRKRIARGSGRSVQEVNGLLKQYDMMQKMARSLKGRPGGRRGRRPFPPLT